MLWDNSQIWPPGSYWAFRFTDPSGKLYSEVTTQVLVRRPPIVQGGSVDLSALFSGSAKPIPVSSPRIATPGFPFTVATLPTGEQPGTIAWVNDGINPSDSVVGGGTTLVCVYWNGSSWQPLGGGGAGTGGLLSINGDFSANQVLEGRNGIGVSTTNGVTIITGPGPGTGVANVFVDAEVVTATSDPRVWTLGSVPNPPTSLQLYQNLSPGLFGAILLTNNIDYTIFGNTITTNNVIAGGTLYAWYRYPAITMQPPTFFIDREIVSGNGNAWALAATPNPPESLQLFQPLPQFGGILLIPNVDYVLSGAGIITYRALPAGSLIAYYRYITPPTDGGVPPTQILPPSEVSAVATAAGTVWNLPFTPVATSIVIVFRDGLRLNEISGDYTISGSSITFTTGFEAGSVLSALYWL
jgi:hypothetical protein